MVTATIWLCATALATAPEDAVQHAVRRGNLLFWYDRAAWVTTDDLQVKLSAARLREMGGWVVTPAGDGYHVDYVGKGDAGENVIYAADINGPDISRAEVFRADAAPRLSGMALRMVQALTAARAEMARHSEWQPCARALFNTVVLPPENGVVPVYFLTPQTQLGSFPFGGHYEVDVAADGHIASTRAFTRACVELTTPQSVNGAKPDSMFLTHLLDRQPTEIHVFQQFPAGMPLYVGIDGTKSVWKVENGRIDRVKKPVR